MKIIIINGPNLNMLGKREASHYGGMTLDEINAKIQDKANEYGIQVKFFQSGSEGAIVERIHDTISADGIILNAGAYTHTSIAIRDALLAVKVPFIEVHLSNVFARETFRHISLLSDVAEGVICGFKEYSYLLALEYFAKSRRK